MTLRSRDAGKTNTDDTIYTNVNHEVTGAEVAAVLQDLWDSAFVQEDFEIIASATTTDLSSTSSNFARITGTTAITSFGPGAAGLLRILKFVDVLTLTDSANLIIPGGANITTATNDIAWVHSIGGGIWRVIAYTKASGKAIIASSLSDIVASGALALAGWTDIASAATTDLGSVASNFARVTGTTGISGLGTAAATVWRLVRFASALTLTYNATSLILPGSANITTAADDCALFKSDGSGNWRCMAYWKRSGKDVIAPSLSDLVASGALALVDWTDIASAATTDLGTVASNFARVTGTVGISALGTAATTVWRFVRFAGALTLTYNVTSLILPGSADIATAADDCALFKSEGSGNWRCVAYWKRSGKVVIAPSLSDLVTTGALALVDWTDIASAATTDLGTVAGNFARVTGTTGITALGTSSARQWRIVRFAAVLTITHNATSLILPGAANIATVADDCALFKSEGSGNWRCMAYWRASGKPVVGPAAADVTDATATGISAMTAANAAALATAAGLGTASSPTFVALTLSGGQIAFPAAQNASAGVNTLDDYEEGTFTPAVASTGGGTPTYTTQVGFYTKIGNRVLYSVRIVLATLGTLAAGNVSITGLPFTSESTANHTVAQAIGANNLGATAITCLTATIGAGVTVIAVNVYAAGAGSSLTVAMLTATAVLNAGGNYATA